MSVIYHLLRTRWWSEGWVLEKKSPWLEMPAPHRTTNCPSAMRSCIQWYLIAVDWRRRIRMDLFAASVAAVLSDQIWVANCGKPRSFKMFWKIQAFWAIVNIPAYDSMSMFDKNLWSWQTIWWALKISFCAPKQCNLVVLCTWRWMACCFWVQIYIYYKRFNDIFGLKWEQNTSQNGWNQTLINWHIDLNRMNLKKLVLISILKAYK